MLLVDHDPDDPERAHGLGTATGRCLALEQQNAEKAAFCMKNAWEIVREAAGVSDVTPHTLRHTAITWAMQNGVSIWDAAGFLGAAADTIESEYAHHHPDYQENALSAVNLGGRKGRC